MDVTIYDPNITGIKELERSDMKGLYRLRLSGQHTVVTMWVTEGFLELLHHQLHELYVTPEVESK